MVFEVHQLYLVVRPNIYSKVAWNAGDKRTLIRHGTPKDSGLVGWGSTFGSPRPHHGPVFLGEREGSAGALAWYRAKGWSILYKIKDMWSSRQNFRVSSFFLLGETWGCKGHPDPYASFLFWCFCYLFFPRAVQPATNLKVYDFNQPMKTRDTGIWTSTSHQEQHTHVHVHIHICCHI